MVASKMAITRRWLFKEPSTLNQYIDIVNSIQYGMYDIQFKITERRVLG